MKKVELKTNIIGIKKVSDNKLEIRWKNIPDNTGYSVYRSSSYHGTYDMMEETKTNTYIDTVNPGNRYYYKIKVCMKAEDKNIYSKCSSIKSGYIKLQGIPSSIPAKKISKFNISGNQLITVTAENTLTSKANFSFYVKNQTGKWILDFSTIGHIGKNGLGKTKEGDDKTPVGVYHFTAAFGVASKPEDAGMPYVKVDETHWLVSDSASKYYNQFVSASKKEAGDPLVKTVNQDWASSCGEQLYKYTKAYHYSLILDYNPENIPYKGSAIFLHCYSDGQYTAGCVAIPEAGMKYLLQHLEVQNNKIMTFIAIDTVNNEFHTFGR